MKHLKILCLNLRSRLALALAMALWFPAQARSAEPGDGNMMNHGDGWIHNSWGGGMWLWTVIGVLVVVLLVVAIITLSKRRR